MGMLTDPQLEVVIMGFLETKEEATEAEITAAVNAVEALALQAEIFKRIMEGTLAVTGIEEGEPVFTLTKKARAESAQAQPANEAQI